jgi:hypothetical protein
MKGQYLKKRVLCRVCGKKHLRKLSAHGRRALERRWLAYEKHRLKVPAPG